MSCQALRLWKREGEECNSIGRDQHFMWMRSKPILDFPDGTPLWQHAGGDLLDIWCANSKPIQIVSSLPSFLGAMHGGAKQCLGCTGEPPTLPADGLVVDLQASTVVDGTKQYRSAYDICLLKAIRRPIGKIWQETESYGET